MKVDEIQPCYCEGLIHLDELFDSKALNFVNEKLIIDTSEQKINTFVKHYFRRYQKIV